MANIIGGKIGASSVVVNDYNISIENIEGGHRLKIKRGSEIQNLDVMDGATDPQVVYELATPTTIQLTPQEIAALEGLNTLYSSTGDTEVAGRTDMGWLTQGILDRLAALESAAVSE